MTQANAINDKGTLAGLSGNDAAILYSDGVQTNLGFAPYGNATAINNSDHVVGTFHTPIGNNSATMQHSFLYINGVITYIGPLGDNDFSSANSINNYDQIVGQYNVFSKGVGGAFLYSDGTLLDLNSLLDPVSGWYLSSANDINDLGQIVGSGTINGQTHAFLLSPSTVPVPAAAWLFGSGLMGLAGVARKRKAVN